MGIEILNKARLTVIDGQTTATDPATAAIAALNQIRSSR
jgi:hypothetical protein